MTPRPRTRGGMVSRGFAAYVLVAMAACDPLARVEPGEGLGGGGGTASGSGSGSHASSASSGGGGGEGLVLCGNELVDLLSNPGHCGVCNGSCFTGQPCLQGACRVAASETDGAWALALHR